ncbi:MAG TPA: hypothetical protein VFY13_09875, partial [Luteolibacter sp.]|nr:hypothetical protein [Luteolibacter sp.]
KAMSKPNPIRLATVCTLTLSIIIEASVRILDLWTVIPQCDKIMHLLWGMNIFLLLSVFFEWRIKDALFGVLAWQLIWEFSEMIGDRILIQPAYMHDHFHYDGTIDTLMDLAGALIGWMLLKGKAPHALTRSVFPDGSITLVCACMGLLALAGPSIARRTTLGDDPLAMGGMLLTMVIYLLFLLHRNGRLAGANSGPPSPSARMAEHGLNTASAGPI